MGKPQIIYPAPPPSPAAPTLSELALGSLSGRTEWYLLTYVTADGETPGGDEASISIDASNVAAVAPPALIPPYAVYGYNVYAGATSGSEKLQNSTPLAINAVYVEPQSGLVSGGATPPTTWASSTLKFGEFTYPTKVPFDQREFQRHKNVSSSGAAEIIFEHTDEFIEFEIPAVELAALAGADIADWKTFVEYAEQGGLFAFYKDWSVNSFTLCNLWDDNWDAAWRSAGFYSFKMKWRVANV
jgi:hypothetical protein